MRFILVVSMIFLWACEGSDDGPVETQTDAGIEADVSVDPGDGTETGSDSAVQLDTDACEDVDCDDGLGCTDDECSGGACINTVQETSCLIEDICYDDGDPSADNACEICAADVDPEIWTAAEEGALCDSSAGAGACTSGICEPQVLDPCAGIDCDDSLGCTDDVCLEGACTHTVQAAFCLIDGICYDDGDSSADNDCAVCDLAVDQDTWTNAATGTACGSGESVGVCSVGICEPLGVDPCESLDCDDALGCTDDICLDGACTHTIQTSFCLIDGACYDDGDANAGNQCKVCNAGVDQDTWSAAAVGALCGSGASAGTCNGGVCEPTNPDPCGGCDDGVDCTEDSCVAFGVCVHVLNPGCCVVPDDCDDGVACVENSCSSAPAACVPFSDVQAIFETYGCSTCHGGNEESAAWFLSGGLNLSSHDNVISGGNNPPTVVVGDASTSNLYLKMTSNPPFASQMPKNESGPVTDDDLAIVAAWIDGGAVDSCADDLTEEALDDCTDSAQCIVVPYNHCCGSTKRAINAEHEDAYNANSEWQVFNDEAICAVIGMCAPDDAVTEATCESGNCQLVFP